MQTRPVRALNNVDVTLAQHTGLCKRADAYRIVEFKSVSDVSEILAKNLTYRNIVEF